MYSKRKLFIFHNPKIIEHIESQPCQSRYIENLITKDIEQPQQNISQIYTMLQNLMQQNNSQPLNQINQDNISNSVFSILNSL